jgi:predicted dehydrogenase
MESRPSTGKPLRVAIIGAGGISRAHLPACQNHPDQAELAGVCDIREDAARKTGETAR